MFFSGTIAVIQYLSVIPSQPEEEFVVNFSSDTIQSHAINLNTSLDNNEVTHEDIKKIYKKIKIQTMK